MMFISLGNLYRYNLFGEQFDSDYQKPKTCYLFDLLIPPLYSVLRQMNLKYRLKFMHKSLRQSIIYKHQSIIYNSKKSGKILQE